MAQLPPALIHSLETCKGFDKSSFEKIHQSGEQVTSVRINPFKRPRKNSKEGSQASDVLAFFKEVTAIPWTKYGFYLDERPSFTFDPYFHAGCYYVQEASSMFLEQALLQTEDLSRPLRLHSSIAAGSLLNKPLPLQGASTTIMSKNPLSLTQSLGSLFVTTTLGLPHFIILSVKILARDLITSCLSCNNQSSWPNFLLP